MARRSYNQFCTLARSLDLVGERWTLLVVRELMLGPKRFTDLLDGLPGIGRNLLAARLRHMEDVDLVRRRTLPPPAGSRVYELTEDGAALGPAMAELSRWGVERLGPPRPGTFFHPAWAVFPLSYMANREAARGVHEEYEFHVDAEVFHLRVDDGVVEPLSGPARRPELTITVDTETFRQMFSDELSPIDAITQNKVAFDGPGEAIGRCLAILAAG